MHKVKFIAVALLIAAAPGAAIAGKYPSKAIAWSADGRLIARTRDSYVKVWDANTGSVVQAIKWEEDSIVDMAFSPDNKWLAAIGNSTSKVVLWNTTTWRIERTWKADNVPTFSLAFSADGRTLATGSVEHVRLWDPATGRKTRQFDFGPVEGMRFSPDGQTLAAWGALRPLILIDVASGADRFASLPTFKHPSPSFVAFTNDGTRIVGASEMNHGLVQLTDVATLSEAAHVDSWSDGQAHGAVGAVCLKDGKWAIVAHNGGIDWYKLPAFDYKGSWNFKGGPVGIAVNPDGTRSALALDDGFDVKVIDNYSSDGTVVKLLNESGDSMAAKADSPKSQDSPSAQAPPPGSEEQLKVIAGAAEDVLDAGRNGPTAEQGKACIKAIDDAVVSGLDPLVEVKIATVKSFPGARETSGFRYLTLASARSLICVPAYARAYTEKVGSTASSACTWIDKLEHQDGAYGRDVQSLSLLQLATDQAKACAAAVKAARGAGVPDSTMVEFHSYDASVKSPLSLADVDAKVCALAAKLGGAQTEKKLAEEKARYAPYLKALSGDKKTMFWEKRMLDGDNYYGHGGKSLTQAADFKNSDVWYYYVHDRNGVYPRWDVEGWTFKGDKQAGTYDKSGLGEDPPSSAFR